MDLKWEPNYRIIRLKSPWQSLVEDQVSGKAKCCNVADLKPKHPTEDWELKPSSISRAARFINHPDNLPNVDLSIDYDLTVLIVHIQKHPRGLVNIRYNLRSSSKVPT